MWLKLWSHRVLRNNQPCIWEPIGVYYADTGDSGRTPSKMTNKYKIGTVDFRSELKHIKVYYQLTRVLFVRQESWKTVEVEIYWDRKIWSILLSKDFKTLNRCIFDMFSNND